MKRQVTRTCMGCNQKKDKSEFIRIVKNKENVISIDETGKKQGRGAYICKDKTCLEKLKNSKRLNRVFEIKSLPEDVYEELKTWFEKEN